MKISIILGAAVAFVLSACGSKSGNTDNYTDNLPVVAHKVACGSDSLVVVDINASSDIALLKASDLIDDLQVIRLENSDSAIVGAGAVWATDKRIIIYEEGVVKQFDRTGKYLGRIGNRGQGPGEYSIAPYDIYVDETAGKIYISQYGAKSLFEYNTDGTFVKDIPLAQSTPKSRIRVSNADSTITVFAMQFNDNPEAINAWTQDFNGNIISQVRKPWLSVTPDFSNEIYASFTGNGEGEYTIFDLYTNTDSLYSYRNGSLIPAMTADFGGKAPMHSYLSTPGFYGVIQYGKPVLVSENSYEIPDDTPFIIDRKTLRGGYANLLLDPIGPIIIENNWLGNRSSDYFIMSLDPAQLAELIEKAPAEHPMVTKENVEAMHKLAESIDPDDNNYIIIGRWK